MRGHARAWRLVAYTIRHPRRVRRAGDDLRGNARRKVLRWVRAQRRGQRVRADVPLGAIDSPIAPEQICSYVRVRASSKILKLACHTQRNHDSARFLEGPRRRRKTAHASTRCRVPDRTVGVLDSLRSPRSCKRSGRDSRDVQRLRSTRRVGFRNQRLDRPIGTLRSLFFDKNNWIIYSSRASAAL